MSKYGFDYKGEASKAATAHNAREHGGADLIRNDPHGDGCANATGSRRRVGRVHSRQAGLCIICTTGQPPAGMVTCACCRERVAAAARARRTDLRGRMTFAETRIPLTAQEKVNGH